MGNSPDHDPNYDAYYYWAQAKGYSYAKEKVGLVVIRLGNGTNHLHL